MFLKKRAHLAVVVLGLLVGFLGLSFAQERIASPAQELDLRTFGFKLPTRTGHGTVGNLAELFDDVRARVVFVDPRQLAVYFSDGTPEGPAGQPATRMEAFFVDTDARKLVSHEVWHTRKRRFFSERYDTQARIMPIAQGFLVHAENSLTAYSPSHAKIHEIELDPSQEWAAIVAPRGKTFFLEHSDPGVVTETNGVSFVQQAGSLVAQGDWLDSATFERLRGVDIFPGMAMSVSDEGFVTRAKRCIDFQRVGAAPNHVCCGDPCGYGTPLFLEDGEVVSFYLSGFKLLSTGGQVLWGRDASDPQDHLIEDCKHSLDGNRFAISIHWDRSAEFDHTRVPGRSRAIIVYDRSKRAKIFDVLIESKDISEFALSPDGRRLAILIGTTLSVYGLPPAT